MGGMKRLVALVLLFALLTPSLVCGMAFCPIQSAQAAVKTDPPPCHEAKSTPSKGPMFVLDCMGVDLFSGSSAHVLTPPDLTPAIVAFPVFESIIGIDRVALIHLPIRGPPPNDLVSSSFFFASTTRLLI